MYLKEIKWMAVIVLLAILSGCGKPKDLKFGMAHNVAVKSFSTSGITLEAVLPIENPNGYRINAKDADMSLMAGDKEIAHIKQNLPVTLPGNSKGEYTINATISLSDGNIMSAMNVFNSGADLSLNGTVNVSSFMMHKNLQVHQTGIQNYLKPIIGQVKLF